MPKLHETLIKKIPWYKRYHNLKSYQVINLLVFSLFTVFIFLVIASAADILPKFKSTASQAASLEKGGKVKYTSSRLLPIGSDNSVLPGLSVEKTKPKINRAPSSQIQKSSAVDSDDQPWELIANLAPFTVLDVSFSNQQVGYLVGHTDQNGQVRKTTNGGRTWQVVLNYEGNNTPYYLYGVSAIDQTVSVVGFNNVGANRGFVVKSTDGGNNWSEPITLSSSGWVGGVKFINSLKGMVLGLTITDFPYTQIFKTETGGNTSKEWTAITPIEQEGWYGRQFTFLPSGKAAIAGINYCQSENFGSNWNCRPSIDSVFDGGAYFFDNEHGWTAGGSISPELSGWVHMTEDGGKTWSDRVLETHWPIRTINFVSNKKGWAMGGDWNTGVGGIFGTEDGGLTWFEDLNTDKEMTSCDTKKLIHTSSNFDFSKQVWCAGFDGDRHSTIYTKLIK